MNFKEKLLLSNSNQNNKILWDFQIQTDKLLAHNTTDITVAEKKKVRSIDVAIPKIVELKTNNWRRLRRI